MKQQSKTRKEEPVAAAPAAIRPRVDVREDAGGITLWADLPGVSPEKLHVDVDRETLSIAAEATIALPEGLQPLHAEVRSQSYRRSFALSSELDPDAISANLKDGVLELRIPRRAGTRARRIEVQVA